MKTDYPPDNLGSWWTLKIS